MGKIKHKPSNTKISANVNTSRECCSEQYPWFSFRSLTTNSKYNLHTLPAGHEREQILSGLFSRLSELSSKPWVYWLQQPKRIGLETLSYSELRFSANTNIRLSEDTPLYVFRFDTHNGSGQGRIIGYKTSPCSVLHIVGYDVDFSAYNHG